MTAHRFALCAVGVILVLGSATAVTHSADGLLIEFVDVNVGVVEPPGWHGALNGDRLALRPEQGSALITVIVKRKGDKAMTEDFAVDMRSYKAVAPEVEVANLDVSHSAYGATARVYSAPQKLHEYVAYINPKKRSKYLVETVMSAGSHPASEIQLRAFLLVVSSIVVLPR